MPDKKVEVKLEPPEASFVPSLVVGGFSFSHHKLKNNGKERVAMKIKCSDNTVYRLRPVHSVLEPGKDLTLTIARLPVPDKADKLVVHIIAVSNDVKGEKEASMAFKQRTTPADQQILLNLSAQNPVGNQNPKSISNR